MTGNLDLPISERDQAALDAATAAGLLIVPTSDTVSELSPQRAVFLSVARHIARVTGRVENFEMGTGDEVALQSVRFEWPKSWDAASYPIAVLSEVSTTENDVVVGRPVTEIDPVTGHHVDVISDDDASALWYVGEDIGEGAILIFAAFETHANALAKAVSDSLIGSMSRFQGAILPLPEAYLPPPFRERTKVEEFPLARVQLESNAAAEKSAQAEGNAWRADVHFSWQARRITARPRIPDLKPEVFVTVGDCSTAKEIV